ncbi:MAG: ribose 5-phosphate isomerase B [Puniceicoccales bacterium]|jgi:RpiB/LacA/LacB family sugar-phosphate isomerase|nr:ribose 5-phosphate isomerase B [Puniceicoccales bacterium]
MKISVGSDHGGYKLAMLLIKYLSKSDMDIFYYGTFSGETSVDYPDYARCVGEDIASFKSDFGLLVCKSGTGMSIAANKVCGVRAANCWNVEIAKFAREHNDANILCLGASFVNAKTAQEILDTFLNTQFATRHLKRIEKITILENSSR